MSDSLPRKELSSRAARGIWVLADRGIVDGACETQIPRSARDDSIKKVNEIMGGEKRYYVYILTNPSRTLYTGMTNNLRRRLDEHKRKLVPGFTARYNINRLVYFEVFEDVRNAIDCEKKVKSWTRAKRVA